MIFFALTSAGLEEAVSHAKPQQDAVWCGANAISETEFAACEGVYRGVPLTRFAHALESAQLREIADAAATIEEHHPGQRVWLEACMGAQQ